MRYERILSSGVEVLTVGVPHVESVSVAFVVRVGSAHESDDIAGVSHFLEHIAFRGSEKYSMREIKYTIESVGGVLNAFTGRTSTVYYFKVPDFRAKEAMDVLTDIVFRPRISREDVEIERKVILQEYMMSLENPEDRLHDTALEKIWGIPYGRSIMGRKETIERIEVKDIVEYHRSNYVPEKVRIVVVGKAGSVDLEELDIPRISGDPVNDPEEPVFLTKEGHYTTMRDLEHVHVLLVKEAPGILSKDYPKFLVLNTILGSGMSSYLFEEIREKEGLVYEISSEVYTLKRTGLLGVYFSTSPDNVSMTLEKLVEVLSRLEVGGYIDYGKGRFIGKMKMAKESPASLMWFYVDQLGLDVARSPEEYIEEVERMNVSDLEKFKEGFLMGRWVVFGVGPEGYELETLSIDV